MLSKLYHKLRTTRSLREAIFVYSGAVVNGGALFLLNIVLARALSPESFGAFSLAVLALGTVAELSDFGLNAGFLRFAPAYLHAGEHDKLKQLVKTVWNWRVSMSIILTVGGVILAGPIAQYIFKQPQLTGLLRFSFVGIGGVILLGFVTTYLQASERFATTALMQALKGVLRIFFITVLVLLHVRSLYIFVGIYLAVPWFILLFTYHYLPARFYAVVVHDDVKKKLHSQLARFSFWITVWSFAAIVSSRVDQIMVSSFLDLKSVALYSVAFQFVFIYTIAVQSVSSVLTPKLNKLSTKEELLLNARRVLRWVVPVAVVAAVLIYPSQYIVLWLFGAKYAASMPLYVYLSYGVLINFLAIPLPLIISVYNRTELVAFSGFLQLAVNVVCNLILIPIYGIYGVVATYIAGNIVAQLYNVAVVWYLVKTKPLSAVV